MGDRPLAIVDIDGVVADVRHRLHHLERRPKDWDAFFAGAADDPPHAEGLALVRMLATGHEVVYLTGRPVRLRTVTLDWLDRHGIGGHRLVMRSGTDRRPAAQVKVRLLGQLAAGRQVAVVVDDDAAVIAAMAGAGYRTFHADWEILDATDRAALFTAQEVEGQT